MANFTSTSGSYTTTLTVTQTSQNTANNTSTLTYSLTLTKNAGSGLWNNNSCPWSITIDGTQVASGTFTYDFRNYSSLTLKSSTTTTVNHNSDGTKTVSVSASVNMNNSDYVSVMQPSGSLTLTTIPRASDVTVSNYSITNTTGSISATITSKANFYHKWRYKVGSGSWSAWQNKGQINNTSSTVTVANTTLLAGMPTSTSTTFYIEVQTYSDSGYATLVGTKSASSTISVNTSNIKPSISLGNIAINSSPISGYAVAGYSSVKSTATTTNSSGASSVTNYFTVSHGSLVSSSSTTTSTTVTTNTVPANASNYTLTIYAYAKDSRGAVSSTVSKSITVYGYQPPTTTLNAYRVASSSATTEDGAGTYAYVTFSGAVSSSVNSQNTVQSTTCTYSGSISGTATSGGHYALADTQSVTFTLTVTDKVTSSTTQKTISTASYPLDLYDNGSGTVGAGVGVVAQAGWLSSSLKNDFSKGGRTRLGIHNAFDPSNNTSGSGFMIIATITNKNAYNNKPVVFLVQRRGVNQPSRVSLRFDGANSSDPGLASFYADFNHTDFYLYKSATSTWQLICYKTNYDQISIQALYADSYILSMMDIDTSQSVLSAVPDGATQASQSSFPLASTATIANNYTVTDTNPTSTTIYYATFVAGTTANTGYAPRVNDGFMYRTREGSSSQLGYAVIYVGNAIANGTAGNKKGMVRLHSSDATYTDIEASPNGNGYSAFLPNAPATTYMLGERTLWSNTLKGGNTLSLDVSAWARIRIYAKLYAINAIYEIDLSTTNAYEQISGYRYSGGATVPEFTASGGLEYLVSQCLVSTDKKTIYHYHCGYQAVGSGYTDRNDNNNYFIYKIVGLSSY